MQLIQDKNKVYMFKIKAGKASRPRPVLQLIGRNHASTFTGLCSEHDATIFKPIDTQDFDPANEEHLFLIAYRAVLREHHAIMEGATRMQVMLHKAVEEGRVAGDEWSPPMAVATENQIRAYTFYRYKSQQFDIPYIEKRYNALAHDVIILEDQDPTLAARLLIRWKLFFVMDLSESY